MLRPRKDRLMPALENLLLTVLMGAGFSACILSSMYNGYSLLPIFLSAAAVGLLFVLSAVSHNLVRGAVILALLLVAAGFFRIGPVFPAIQALRAIFLYTDTLDTAILPYRRVLECLVPILMSGMTAVGLVCDSGAISVLLFLYALLTGGIAARGSVPYLPIAASVLGLLLFFARKRTHRPLLPWPLGVTALLLLAAFFVSPAAVKQDPALNRQAQELYQTLQDYLPQADGGARSGFSLKTEGYLPLADEQLERLGGRAEPTDEPVMEVRTDRTLYLRGIAANSYTGLTWDDTLSDRRYLYADVIQLGLRRALFDEYLPAGAQPQRQSASVRMLSAAASTLYVPQRLRSLEMRSEHMVPYFNAGSELFVTRDLMAGDSYDFTYLYLPADSEATAQLIREASRVNDVRYEEIYRFYTALPSHIQQEIKVISSDASGGEEDLYLRALSIRDYLRDSFPYSLDVSDPPKNVDFTAWFLLREKRGYCTYFATALTVLCRLQGIPARYVTGYIVKPDGDGLTTVTRKNAHAWTEIYLNGFGWLTLDATPGREYGEDDSANDGQPPAQQTEDEPQSTPTPSPAPEPPETEPTVEPSMPPFGTPEPQPTEAPEPDQKPTEQPRGISPLWLLMLLLLVPAVYRLRDPLLQARRRPKDAPAILFDAVMKVLAQRYRPRGTDETLQEYLRLAQEEYPGLPLEDLSSRYSAWLYGQKDVDPAPMTGIWRAVWKDTPPLYRLWLRLKPSRRRAQA